MRELRAFFAVILATALSGPAVAASSTRQSHRRPEATGPVVADHIPQFDGPVMTRTAPDGRTWAAWTYLARGEYDIALSSREAGSTTWSAPVFFGRRSGADEIDPAIAVDAGGTAYLAFAASNPPRVVLSVLAAGSVSWSEPIVVSGTETASNPTLMLVGDRLVIGFRTATGVGMIDLLPAGGEQQVDGIQDGPDGVDPLGAKGGVHSEPPAPRR